MYLVKSPIFYACMKHREVQYHYVCELILSSKFKLRYIQTDGKADIFTKALRLDKLQHFLEMLGLQHLGVLHLRGITDQRTDGGRSTPEEDENDM